MLHSLSQKVSLRIKEPKIAFDLIPASDYTLKELTDVYNQTRIDYLVPMPMNEAKLREYVETYNVNLEHSLVAVSKGVPFGLAMLGLRTDKTWATRLGITPDGREKGVGRSVMEGLIRHSVDLGAKYMVLEVIKDNIPARRLFEGLGFERLRELLVIRRAPLDVNTDSIDGSFRAVGFDEAINLLETRSDTPSWITDTLSLRNTENLSALIAELPDGSRGWLVYQNNLLQLSRLILETEQGDPRKVAQFLLQTLHTKHSFQDTVVENIVSDDQHWPIFRDLGYFVSFVRIEMKLDLSS